MCGFNEELIGIHERAIEWAYAEPKCLVLTPKPRAIRLSVHISDFGQLVGDRRKYQSGTFENTLAYARHCMSSHLITVRMTSTLCFVDPRQTHRSQCIIVLSVIRLIKLENVNNPFAGHPVLYPQNNNSR